MSASGSLALGIRFKENITHCFILMTQDEIIKTILAKEKLDYIRRLSGRTLMCKRMEGGFVVMKFATQDKYPEFVRAQKVLEYLNKYEFDHIVFPEMISISEQSEPYSYTILSYAELAIHEWSPVDDAHNWGGKTMTLDYLGAVLDVLADFERIKTTDLGLYVDITQLEKVKEQLSVFQNNSRISTEIFSSIKTLFDQHAHMFYSSTPMLTNDRFYPGNVLLTAQGKPYIVDWDGARAQIAEQVKMSMWCGMFGNQAFQQEYLGAQYRRPDFNVQRFQIGLILAATRYITDWQQLSDHTQAVAKMFEYINNYAHLIPDNVGS